MNNEQELLRAIHDLRDKWEERTGKNARMVVLDLNMLLASYTPPRPWSHPNTMIGDKK